MFDFKNVRSMQIPNGNVVGITANGLVIWGKDETIKYVSFGDSIAVGHRIDENWEKDYGWNAQYGVNGRTSTTLVPGCYTDIIRGELESIYGKQHVLVTSFARSGDKVSDLMIKLSHETIQKALKKADLVTICIGANDVLHYALTNLEDYIATADSSTIDGYVAESLAVLNDDSNANSYMSLLNKLNEINPDAKYVFTTVYNPYKHLWLEEGSEKGSFFYHVLNNIPPIVIDVDQMVENMFGIDDLGIWNFEEWRWVSLELNIDLGSYIKANLLSTPAVKMLFKSVNAIGTLAEGYIDGNDKFVGLNPILRNKINSYRETHPNFALAETKKLFDLFPSKTDTREDVDYSDLVNVEFAKDTDVSEADWGALWRGESATAYWTQLANKHLSFKNALPSTNAWDYVSFDMNGFSEELVADIVAMVIEPDVDPHPESRGHQVLKRSFSNMIGLVKYEPNGGRYVEGDVVLNGGKLSAPETEKADKVFGGWCTDADLTQMTDPNRTDFVDYDSNITLADLVSGNTVIPKPPKVTLLYAKWYDPIVLKNLVPSMDSLSFEVRSSSGTCEMSTAHAKYGSTALCNTGVDGYDEMYAMTTTKFKLIPSHTYYACAEVYQEEKLGSIDFFWPSGSPSMFGGKATGDAGTWKKWSNVTTRSTFAEGEYPIRLDFNNGGTAGKIWYDGLMLIDLTEAFGVGNEPSLDWCNANIPYFVGSGVFTKA